MATHKQETCTFAALSIASMLNSQQVGSGMHYGEWNENGCGVTNVISLTRHISHFCRTRSSCR